MPPECPGKDVEQQHHTSIRVALTTWRGQVHEPAIADDSTTAYFTLGLAAIAVCSFLVFPLLYDIGTDLLLTLKTRAQVLHVTRPWPFSASMHLPHDLNHRSHRS